MAFNPGNLVYAFGDPPERVKIYKQSLLYTSDDAISAIKAEGYMDAASDRLRPGDLVTVTSSHPDDGAEGLSLEVRKGPGDVIALAERAIAISPD